MKNTGMIRKVDELGRVVIPVEIRNKFEIEEHTEIEICVKGNQIILQKNDDKKCPLCNERCGNKDKFCSKCGFEFN